MFVSYFKENEVMVMMFVFLSASFIFKGFIYSEFIYICRLTLLYYSYLFLFLAELPWTRCDGWWTTDACFRQDQARDFYKNMSMTPQYNNSTPLSLSKYKNDASTRTAITNNSFQNRPQLQQMISTEQFWE